MAHEGPQRKKPRQRHTWNTPPAEAEVSTLGCWCYVALAAAVGRAQLVATGSKNFGFDVSTLKGRRVCHLDGVTFMPEIQDSYEAVEKHPRGGRNSLAMSFPLVSCRLTPGPRVCNPAPPSSHASRQIHQHMTGQTRFVAMLRCAL